MKTTITTLFLALAPALPIVSAQPSQKRQSDSANFPITKFCTGLSITPDGTNRHLHADNCAGNAGVTVDLDSCIGNFGGSLAFATNGHYSGTCDDCTVNENALMSCLCGQGAGKDFIVARIDLTDCQFLWYDQPNGVLNCEDLERACPNSG
ncbi:hypothetical protein K449DRAFT_398184 [Hypoxylon sp. EC38]|nr:hypothetical protein K449DRAFT_398184 [Hypoxylon sp. EC38]